jgi:hypothetical protein
MFDSVRAARGVIRSLRIYYGGRQAGTGAWGSRRKAQEAQEGTGRDRKATAVLDSNRNRPMMHPYDASVGADFNEIEATMSFRRTPLLLACSAGEKFARQIADNS